MFLYLWFTQISGERLQDQWSSGSFFCFITFSFSSVQVRSEVSLKKTVHGRSSLRLEVKQQEYGTEIDAEACIVYHLGSHPLGYPIGALDLLLCATVLKGEFSACKDCIHDIAQASTAVKFFVFPLARTLGQICCLLMPYYSGAVRLHHDAKCEAKIR